jgi:hypothetical protein
MTANVNFRINENSNLRIYFVRERRAECKAHIEDTENKQFVLKAFLSLPRRCQNHSIPLQVLAQANRLADG